MKWEYAPTGLSDLVVYFVRRIFTLLKPGGFTAFITTNSIKDGDIRKDGLDQVLAAVATSTWPLAESNGRAERTSLFHIVAIHKGPWNRKTITRRARRSTDQCLLRRHALHPETQ